MRATEDEWAGLMRSALGGDSAAYRHFLRAVTPNLRAIAARNLARYGAAATEAEDVVQETLLAIHAKRYTWDVGRPIGPWIAAIARHKLIDMLRRRGFHQTVPIEVIAETMPCSGPAPDMGHDAERMLDCLGERQRAIVRSMSIEGASVRETAARHGMSEGAVRVSLHRGLKTLAAMFKGSGP